MRGRRGSTSTVRTGNASGPTRTSRAARRPRTTWRRRPARARTTNRGPTGRRPPRLRSMRVTLAQLDPVVGDLLANGRAIIHASARARDDGSGLLVTGELSVIGYPPRDLLRRTDVVDACERAASE